MTMSQLQDIQDRISKCQACPLAATRTVTVPGSGPEDAEILLVGEGPGATEDRTGIPFSGRSGKYLDTVLNNNKIDKGTIFITNVVKCRPPDNRAPTPDEVAACRHFLREQIEAINPKLIVSAGLTATHWFKPQAKTMTSVAGTAHRYGDAILVPVFHPASALRNGSNDDMVKANFERVASFLDIARLPPVSVATPPSTDETPDPPAFVQQTML